MEEKKGGKGGGEDYKYGVTEIIPSSRKQTAEEPTPVKMKIVRMTRHVSTIIKNRLRLLRSQEKVAMTRLSITEEELDNIANEALEAVLSCT